MEGVDWQRLRPLFDEAGVVVFARDCEGRYLYVNRTFEALVGRSATDVVGRSIEEVLPAEAAAAVRESDRQAIAERRGVVFESRAHFGSGLRSFANFKFPLFDGDGRTWAVLGFGTDTTARRRREEALEAASLAVSSAQGDRVFQELTRYLATILNVHLALVGRITDSDPRTVRTLGIYGAHGYRENIEYPLAVTPCRDVVHGGFHLVASGVTERYPEDVYLPKGEVGYAGYPLKDAAGRTIGVIAVLSREPIVDDKLFETVLKIFALRAAAELERRLHEEALAASEANYRAIFEAAEDAIFIHDYDSGAILDVNPKACSTYGYSREEFRRLSVGDISGNVAPYTNEEALRLIGEVRAGRGPLSFEWRRRNKDGALHWDEVTLKKVDIAGRPRILAMTREITERKSAVEALRASEQQYRAIFNASADSLVLRDKDFRVVDVNPAYEAMSGRPRAEALGRNDLTMSPRELTERVKALHQRALAGERVMFEALARRKDGSRFNIETRGVPILHNGEPHVLYIGRDITARKTEEELLRASEEQYRAIFDSSADALVLWDSDMRRVDVNPAYERIYGFTRAEAMAPGYDENGRPVQYDALRREVLRRTLAGERCQLEVESTRKDGSRIYIEVRTIPLQHRGRPHALSISRDITERRLAEAAVRASEEQYRAIFDASEDALVLWNEDLQRVDVNAAYERVYGYSREEVLRGDYETHEPPAFVARRRELVRRTLGGERQRVELESVRKDGTPIHVEVRTIPILHGGRPHVLAIARDITERRLTEERLRASEERHRLLFEMESDAIVLVDVETLAHLDVNRAAVELYGYSREELLALKSTDLSAEAADTRSAMQNGARQAKGAVPGSVRVPLRYHRKRDGTVFPVEITANFFDLHGRRLMIAAIRDITERKAAEEARAQLEAQLRQAQKMEAIGHLTGGIAHDFNNILQSILGNLTLAGERIEALGDAKLARALERAEISAQRARELIQQMLTFSRGRRGEPRLVSLTSLVGEAAKLLRPTLPATIAISADLGAEVPAVKLDPVQAEQVLLNLCINARDAMAGAGSIALAVREVRHAGAVCAACRQPFSGAFVEVSVRDTGPGIPAAVLERMFEPFFSTKEVGKGSGMGLSMVHGIVHEHGGHVLVETAPGEGACFRVVFPSAEGAPGEVAVRSAGKDKKRTLAGAVLIVDDEDLVLELMGDLLSDWGLEVTLKSDAVEAKHAFAAEPQRYDLVLTDHTMPRLTGLELARQIHAIRPGVPVILYTGYGEHIAEDALAAAGVRALARKPVDPAELFRLLKTSLQQTRYTVK
jgi:PAS domain S-box-containing protein